MIDSWTSYRDFQFDSNHAELRASDTNKVSEIALYLKANPSLKVAIDGSTEPRNTNLSDQRVNTVRDALIKAGVPTSRIQAGTFRAGTFDDPKFPRDGRVVVMIRTI